MVSVMKSQTHPEEYFTNISSGSQSNQLGSKINHHNEKKREEGWKFQGGLPKVVSRGCQFMAQLMELLGKD